MVISRFGLVCYGLTPQQQPGSYRGLVWFVRAYRVISRFGLVC